MIFFMGSSQVLSFSDDICLPKPPRDLDFYPTPIDGVFIPMSDEDSEVELSGWEKFMSSAKQKMFFKFFEMLPCTEAPTYFDSVAEARALVKRHFPGKHFWLFSAET